LRTRVLYICDLHGSERCFNKFVNAGKYDVYKANVMILAGDLAGKAIIPIVDQGNGTYIGHTRQIFDEDIQATTTEQLSELEQRVRNAGYYPYRTDLKTVQELDANPQQLKGLFQEVMVETIQRWVRVSEEKLSEKKLQFFIMLGNDDPPTLAEPIHQSKFAVDPEDKVIDLDGSHEMISVGYSNPTPWKTPRECSEEELGKRIEKSAASLKNPKNAVFNLHCPPYDSTIDIAPQLDENLRPTVTMGDLVRIPVGSTAVRAAIEKYQPLISFHGHIHESPGQVKIGRTVCVNPGSEYQSGILRGYIADLEKDKLKQCIRIEA
jgi:Icc-related predicted phosphoesterase